MFINIQKGGKRLLVSKAAFENNFKGQGWSEVGKNPTSSDIQEAAEETKSEKTINNKAKVEESNQEPSEDQEVDEWDEVLEDEEDEGEIEKPLSEMNKEELIQYASKNDISLEGLTSVKQYRQAIKEALNNRG